MRLINACKVAESHFYFEQQKASGGKVLISINCDEKYKMLHHINFSDNLLRMLGFASAIFSKHQFYSKLAIRKSNSNETEEKIFFTHRFNKTGKRLATIIGVANSVVCGKISSIKCSFIAIFVSHI